MNEQINYLNIKPKTPKHLADNRLAYIDYFNRLTKIALSIFEWVNLPESMDARMLEWSLFKSGSAAILYDEELGMINTGAADCGDVNIYGLPTSITCFSFGKFSKNRLVYYSKSTDVDGNDLFSKTDEAVLVKNNYDRTPTMETITLFAERLAEAERICDINLKMQKSPLAMMVNQKQINTVKRMFEQVDGNSPVLIGDKDSLNLDVVKTFKTEAPFIVDKVKSYQKTILRECLTFLGVDNIEEKKERLVVDEVAQNNEEVNLNLQSYLIPRKEACKQVNEKFGLNIDVRVRNDQYNLEKMMDAYERHDLKLDNAVEGLPEV